MLRVRWKLGEWSRSNLFVKVPVVANESVSKVTGARGASPGRWASRGGSISSFMASVYCGSFQSFLAMGFRLAMGGWRSIPAADGESHRRRNFVHKGSRVFVVNVVFFKDLCVKCLVDHVSSVSGHNVSVCVLLFVPYLLI